MSDLRTAAQQALEALEWLTSAEPGDEPPINAAVTALRAALAQQDEPVEPVAKVELMTTGGNAGLATRIVEIDDHLRERLRPGQLLYLAPPQRKPLTSDKDRPDQGATYVEGYGYVDTRAVRVIERAHGIGETK